MESLYKRKNELEVMICEAETELNEHENIIEHERDEIIKYKEELDIVNRKINNEIYDIGLGDIVVLKDEDDIEIKVVLSRNSNDRYVLVLLNSWCDMEFQPYHVFEFNAKFPETPVKEMCERYSLEIVKIIRNK